MSNNRLFSNNDIISGLTKIKKCIADIETPLKNRGALEKNKNLELSTYYNDTVSMFERMKSDSYYGISINDVYSFHDGILEENENPAELVGFKTSTDFSKLQSLNGSTYQNKKIWNSYRSINNTDPLNGKYLRKKAVYGNHTVVNPYVNAFGRKQLGTTIIQEDDYNCAFMNTDALSSVEINTLFCLGGFNYAFWNCKNLKEVIFNIQYAHREIPDDNTGENGYGTTKKYKTFEEFPKKTVDGFFFNPTAALSAAETIPNYTLTTYSVYNGYNKWKKFNWDSRSMHGGLFLLGAFNGCSALRRIAFPTLYKNDIYQHVYSVKCPTCKGTGQVKIGNANVTCSKCNGSKSEIKIEPWFATPEKFSWYFGLDAVSSDVVFEFKDGAFHIDEMYNN